MQRKKRVKTKDKIKGDKWRLKIANGRMELKLGGARRAATGICGPGGRTAGTRHPPPPGPTAEANSRGTGTGTGTGSGGGGGGGGGSSRGAARF